MSLSELKAVLPVPARPLRRPIDDDWAMLVAELGLELPLDYRAYIGTYGTGFIDEFMWIFSPAGILRSLAELQDAEAAIVRRQGAPLYPGYFLHPHRPGLVPLGGTDNGDRVFWFTENPNPPWPIIVAAARDARVDRFDLPFVEWLTRLLRRDLTVTVFPENWPDDEPEFRPR